MLRFKNLAFCDATLLGYKKNGHKKLPYDICFNIQGDEHRLPWYGTHIRTKNEENWDRRLITNNKIGSIQLSDNGQGFYFECYLDQSLRRRPDLDTLTPDIVITESNPYFINKPCVGWCNQNNPDGFLIPLGIIPHYGCYIADDSKRLSIKIPKEFESICNEYDITSEQLINDLINNACNFSNNIFSPRADFRNCKDSHLHQLAKAYINAVYLKQEAI